MNALESLAAEWPALERWLDEALAQPPAARAAWLAALPDTAPVATLRRLLDVQAEVDSGEFMRTLPPVIPPPPPHDGGPDAPAAGATVGPWRLVRELGEGGMGSVWLAERADGTLKRAVALKLPRLAWASGGVERMARERDILATLEHPRIARLYDAGSDALGRPWLALAFVQGRPLTAHADAQALDVRARVALLLQVCEAVAYAHGRLVIHRDLKPANILVGDDGEVRLLDFGIAALLAGGGEAGDPSLTARAGRPLTPAYASPEQRRGEPLGIATDIYSLGVVAYELLTGVRPFEGGTPAAHTPAPDGGDVRPPSETVEGHRRKVLRGALDAIVLRAMQPRPADRYPTVEALRSDLAAWLAGERVQARPDGWATAAARHLRRHRTPLMATTGVAGTYALAFGAGAAALTVTALLAGLGVAAWQAREAHARAREADAARERAQAVQQFLTGLFQTNSTYQRDPERARRTTARELLDTGAQQLEEALRGQPLAQAEMALVLSHIYDELGLAEPGAALARRAAALAEQAEGEASRWVLEALALLVYHLNHTAGGQAERVAAGQRLQQLVDRHWREPSALRALAWLRIAQSRPSAESVQWAERAAAEAEALGATAEAQAAHEVAGQHRYAAGEMAAAALHFERALMLHARLPPARRHEAGTVFIRTGLGECLLATLRPAAAEAALDAAVAAAARTAGENGLDHLQTRLRRARVVAARGRTGEALAELAQVLALASDGASAQPFCELSALLECGHAECHAGLVEAAQATLVRAVERADALRPDGSAAAVARELLALALLSAHRPADARRVIDEAAALRARLGAQPGSEVLRPIVHARAQAALLERRIGDARAELAALPDAGLPAPPSSARSVAAMPPTELTTLRTRLLALQVEIAAGDGGQAAPRLAAPLARWLDATPPADELPLVAAEVGVALGELAWQQGDPVEAGARWAAARARIERTAAGPGAGWRLLTDALARCGEPVPTWGGEPAR